MKIVLALCPVWHIKTPPLGLAYLTAYMKKHGHEVINFDFNIELYEKASAKDKKWWDFTIPEQERISQLNENTFRSDKFLNNELDVWVEKILKTGAEVIGLSTYSESREFSVELTNRLKEKSKNKDRNQNKNRKSDIKIIFGGPLCRKNISDSLWFKHNKAIDYIVIGDGEKTFLSLVNAIENKKEIKNCAGALVKYNRKIVSGKIREPLFNLDEELPFPDFSGFPLKKYTKPNEILIAGSRGCPGNCAFCQDKVAAQVYRTRSAENIFKEIKLRVNQGYDCFEFCDLLLNGNINVLENLCDMIINNNLNIRWGGPIRSNPKMTLNIFRKMKKAGVDCVNLGIESGSQKILNNMRKGYTIKILEKNMKDLFEADIIASVNFLVGFPGETEETIEETLRFIRRNKKYIKHISSLTPMYVMPTSYVHNHCSAYKINKGNNIDQWTSIDGKNNPQWRFEQCTKIFELIQELGIKHECNQYQKEKKTTCNN